MNNELWMHLRDMGILEKEPVGGSLPDERLLHLAKGYFNDPRDKNGEVNF